MSDIVLVALITSVPSTIASLLAFFKSSKALNQSEKNGKSIEEVVVHTNGIKDELVKTTGREEYARGIKDEKAENLAIEEKRAERLRVTGFESRVGPDRLHAGDTEKLA